jgi:hypothetical protein
MDTLNRLAKALGRTTADSDFQQAWASLEAEGWTREDIKTPGEFSECVRLCRQRLSARTLRGNKAPAWIKHAFVLADHAAEASNRDPEVRAFRRDVLLSRLRLPQHVPQWLRARAGRFQGLESLLAFQNNGQIGRVPVAGSAALERLRALVQRLASQHEWPEDTATAFVLTGQTPLRWPIRARVSAELSRVQLTIDSWVPPEAVAEAYRHARETLGTQPRAPRVSARRRALAAFVTTQDGVSARMRLQRWNTAHPRWRYPDVRNFVRDSRRAATRL